MEISQIWRPNFRAKVLIVFDTSWPTAKKKGRHQKEETLNTIIEKMRGMEVDLSEDLPLYFQLQSSLGTHPKPSQVEGIDYPAIYSHLASCMWGEIPKKLNPATRAKLSQLIPVLKQRIQSEPEVPMPEFKEKAGSALERKKELKELRSDQWTADESKAEETLLSGDLRKIEDFFLSHASLNPF